MSEETPAVEELGRRRKKRLYQIAWEKANPEKMRSYQAKARAAHRDKINARIAKWRVANPQRARIAVNAWHAAHPDRVREIKARWRANNREKHRATNVRWNKANPEKRAANKALRRAREISSTISLSKDEFAKVVEIYRQCRLMTQLTGIQYHVDHKIALAKGGLHHPENLQILTAEDNFRKGAR